MSKRPFQYEDYASSTRYRIRRSRRQHNSSSDEEIPLPLPPPTVPSTGSHSSETEDLSGHDSEDSESRQGEQPPENNSAYQLHAVDSPDERDDDADQEHVPVQQDPDDSPDERDVDVDEEHVPEQQDLDGCAFNEEDGDNSSLDGSRSEHSNDTDIDNSDTDDADDTEDPSLYPGAPITQGQSLLSILSFSMSHNITGSCLADLLSLIDLHCIKPNHCKRSTFLFMKYFADIQTPLVKHHYCATCYSELESNDAVCEECNIDGGVSYFIEVPIVHQLSSLLSRSGFYDKLAHRFQRTKVNPDSYEDIYDGSVYKEKSSENNILSSHSNMSLMWYTDGVRLFRSSKVEIWPLFFSVNELPYAERIKPENVILAGLWFGSKKPVPELFLRPFHSDMRALTAGINFSVPNIPDPVKVKCIVLCGTCDLPAKALFLNMTQYNGQFGCQRCEHMGERMYGDGNDENDVLHEDEEEGREQPEHQRRGPGVQVYPFSRFLVARTDEDTRNHAEVAHNTGRRVRGVKGPCALLYLLVMNYITSTSIDVMHCLYSNVVSKLLDFWFLPTFHNQAFSMSRLSGVVDQRMKLITPPSSVQRLPRLISERTYWKSSEFKNWFYFYSIPVLCDLMDPAYFHHYTMLVMAMYLLNQASITENDVVLASRLINEYVSRFQDMYGVRHMSCCIHSLHHLPDIVRQLGPLWTTSCFPYESLNGMLKKLVHGTRFFDQQICRSVSIVVNLSALKQKLLVPGTDAHRYCENMSHRSLRYNSSRISATLSVLGKYVRVPNLPRLIHDALDYSDVEGRNCCVFYRLLKSGMLFVSESYTRTLKSKTTCVKYVVNDNHFIGIIQCFVRVTECLCNHICDCDPKFYAIIRRCETQNPFVIHNPAAELYFIHLLNPTFYEAVELEALLVVCFTINVHNVNGIQCMYAVEPVNTVERE